MKGQETSPPVSTSIFWDIDFHLNRARFTYPQCCGFPLFDEWADYRHFDIFPLSILSNMQLFTYRHSFFSNNLIYDRGRLFFMVMISNCLRRLFIAHQNVSYNKIPLSNIMEVNMVGLYH